MKIKNLLLALSLLTAFGTSEILAQTTATTTAKPKRTYTKKKVAPAASTSESAKPKRTYTKKTDVATTTTTAATTPKAAPTPKTATTTSTTTAAAPKKTSNSGSIFSKVFGSGSSSKSTSTKTATAGQSTKTGEMYNGHPVYVGSRGGRYYINKNGNKTYIK